MASTRQAPQLCRLAAPRSETDANTQRVSAGDTSLAQADNQKMVRRAGVPPNCGGNGQRKRRLGKQDTPAESSETLAGLGVPIEREGRCRNLEHEAAWSAYFFGYSGTATTSRPARVLRACHRSRSIESVTNLTDPSIIDTFTPPVW